MSPGSAHFVSSSKSRRAGICDLAAELLVFTFSFLDPEDIGRCIRDRARSERHDRRSIGYTARSRATATVLRQFSANFFGGVFDHETLDSHPEYIRRFRNLQWDNSTRPSTSTSAMFGAKESWEYFLTNVTYGSSRAGVPSRRWLMPVGTPGDPTRQMKSWVINRTQNLLVTVEEVHTNMQTPRLFEVRFCSLSRSERVRRDHPDAALPCLQISSQPGSDDVVRIDDLFLCIGVSHVVWKLNTVHEHVHNCSIEVFDWRAGRFVSRIDLGMETGKMLPLDDTHVVVLPNAGWGPPQQINIYSLCPSAATCPLVILQLPDPPLNTGSCKMITSRHTPYPEAHFTDDPSQTMIVLTQYDRGQDGEYASHLLMPCSTLLVQAKIATNSASDAPASSDSDGLPIPVPWQDWGPLGCLRLRVRSAHPEWLHRTSLIPWGSRMPLVAFYVPSLVVYVVDINPFMARHARALRDIATLESESASASEATGIVTTIVKNAERVLPCFFDPDCAAIPYVVYRFKVSDLAGGAPIRAVRMCMTGFTVTTSGDGTRPGELEAEETWTV